MKNNEIITQTGFKITKDDFLEVIQHLGTDVQVEVYDARLIAHYICTIIKIIINFEDNKIIDKNILDKEKEFKYRNLLKKLKEKLSNFKEDEE